MSMACTRFYSCLARLRPCRCDLLYPPCHLRDPILCVTDRPHGRSLKWPAVLVRTARPDLSCCLRPWASYCPCNTTVWTNGLLLLTFTGHFLQATHGPSPKKAPCTMLNQCRGGGCHLQPWNNPPSTPAHIGPHIGPPSWAQRQQRFYAVVL